MDNPGPFQFTTGGSAFTVGAAGQIVGDWMAGFAGIAALTLQLQFIFGTGAGTVTVFVQTSIDQGQTAIDIAAAEFTTANGTALFNLSGLTPKTAAATPTSLSLTPGTALDGVLGDMFRVVLVITGAYQNTTLVNVTGMAR